MQSLFMICGDLHTKNIGWKVMELLDTITRFRVSHKNTSQYSIHAIHNNHLQQNELILHLHIKNVA